MIANLIKKVFGTKNDREVRKLQKLVNKSMNWKLGSVS